MEISLWQPIRFGRFLLNSLPLHVLSFVGFACSSCQSLWGFLLKAQISTQVDEIEARVSAGFYERGCLRYVSGEDWPSAVCADRWAIWNVDKKKKKKRKSEFVWMSIYLYIVIISWSSAVNGVSRWMWPLLNRDSRYDHPFSQPKQYSSCFLEGW